MASEIRVNKINNRAGLGTVEYTPTGIIVSGIVTAYEFDGNFDTTPGIVITGIGTAQSLDVDDFVDVGSNIKLGNAGVVTATTFSTANVDVTTDKIVVGTGVTIEANQVANGQATFTGIVTASAFKLSDGSNVGGVESDAQGNTLGGTNAGDSFSGTSALKNTLFGYDAGTAITTSDENTVLGHSALKTNIAEGGNTAIGFEALKVSTSVYNTAVGKGALVSENGSDGYNTAVGVSAGYSVNSGHDNTMVGYTAGQNVEGGDYNIILGAWSRASAAGVDKECTIGGQTSGRTIKSFRIPGIGLTISTPSNTPFPTSGSQLHLPGNAEFVGVVTASNFVKSDGSAVGGVTSDAQGNTVGGSGAGDSFTGTDAENNTLFGKDAGTAITSADSTTAVGKDAGKSITTGSYNQIFGIGAGDAITTGANNTIMGHYAGSAFQTSSENTIIGGNAGGGSSLGSNNVIIGKSCSQSNEGSNNVFIGQMAVVWAGGTGSHNVCVGQGAMEDLTSGNYNTGVGKVVLNDLNTGHDNSALGNNAGNTLTSGSNNLFLGHDAVPSSASVSNEVTIGNSNINHVRVPGIGVSFSEGGAVISGIVTATSFSGDGSNLSNLPASAPVGGASTNSVFFENDIAVAVNYQITSNKNAMSAGPIAINAGIAVTVPSGSAWTIV